MQLTSVRSSVYFHAFDDIEGSVKGAIPGQHTTKLETIQRAMQHCHATPDQTLLIGDSQYDAIGAHQAGIDFLAVTYGFGFRIPLETAEFANVGCATVVEEIIRGIDEK